MLVLCASFVVVSIDALLHARLRRERANAGTYSYTAWYSTTLSAAVCNAMPNGMNTTPITTNVPMTHYINIIPTEDE